MSLDQKRANTVETWTLVATILASSMAFIDGSALNVVLNNLQHDLNASGAQLLWIVNAYLLVLAALILTGGALGDRYGRNRVFGMGIAIFATASLVCGLSPTIDILLGARVVQGAGGALMVPGSLAIINATFRPHRRGRAIGTWSSVGALTTMSGPALGGILASLGIWRAVFFINLPLALVALFALTHVPETRDESAAGHHFDVIGTELVVLALFGITYGAIGLGNGQGHLNDLRNLALPLGIVTLIVFLVAEARRSHPMVPLAIFRSRTFAGTNAMCVFLYGALSGTLFFLPLNLIQVQGYSPALAGLVTLPFSILLATLSPIMGRETDRFGARLLLTVGPCVVALGFVLLALPGITVAPLTTAVMASTPTQQSGIASGVNNAVTRSAQVLALAFLGAVALITFSQSLQAGAASLPLSPGQRAALVSDAGKLGATSPPPGLDQHTAGQVKATVKESFVSTFRLLAIISACMALLSAALAWTLVESPGKIRREEATTPPPAVAGAVHADD